MTYLSAAAAVLSIAAFFPVLRHNLHMFQLNGYKNDEHLSWIRKNIRQQWLLFFGILAGFLRLFIQSRLLNILIILTLIMEILVYRALQRLNNKVPLKYTPRVKRLIFTDILLSLLAGFLSFLYFTSSSLPGILMCLVSLQIIMVIAANIINHPVEAMINRYYINDARRILRSQPGLKIIGVTGSYGKTSVKYYLNTLLKARFNVLMTPGNFNTPLGITRAVRENFKNGTEIFICEMGARRTGEIKEICDLFPPDYGIITAVGPQHLETFHSIENIKKTKFELADALKDKSRLFLNGDNELILEKAPEYPGAVLYGSGGSEVFGGGSIPDSGDVSGSGDVSEGGEAPGSGNISGGGSTGCFRKRYRAENICVSNLGTAFTVVSPSGEREEFSSRLIGAHNVINLLGAIAVSNSLGIPLADLKIPVRRIESVEHRMQIREQGAVTIIDDAYNSNPFGSKAALDTLNMFDGLKVLITPGMVELGESEDKYNHDFGLYASSRCDYILLVGKKLVLPIKAGAEEGGFPKDKLKIFDRLEDALSFALNIRDEKHKYVLLENDVPDKY